MNQMFDGAEKFKQQLCDWDLNGVTDKKDMFNNSPCTEVECVECLSR